MNNMNTKNIQEITFQQVKALTQASVAEQRRLESFDRQFSGIAEVIA